MRYDDNIEDTVVSLRGKSDSFILIRDNIKVPKRELDAWQELVQKMKHLSGEIDHAVTDHRHRIGERQLRHMISVMDVLLEFTWSQRDRI